MGDNLIYSLTGVAVLIETARSLALMNYSIDIVPFNDEKYYGASGEPAYLQHLQNADETVSLLINIDSPCHIGADNKECDFKICNRCFC